MSELFNSKLTDSNIRLSVLWLAHWLLWTFGDMFRIIQPGGFETIESQFVFVATTTAVVQVLLVIASLYLQGRRLKFTNMIFAAIFVLLNIAHIADVAGGENAGWEIYLALFYILVNVMTILTAYFMEFENSG